MAVWRVILTPTGRYVRQVELIRQGSTEVTHQNTTQRTELTIQQFKVTLLVDVKVNEIINLHVITTQKHGSQIVP